MWWPVSWWVQKLGREGGREGGRGERGREGEGREGLANEYSLYRTVLSLCDNTDHDRLEVIQNSIFKHS